MTASETRQLGVVGTEATWRAPCRATAGLTWHLCANKKKLISWWTVLHQCPWLGGQREGWIRTVSCLP